MTISGRGERSRELDYWEDTVMRWPGVVKEPQSS